MSRKQPILNERAPLAKINEEEWDEIESASCCQRLTTSRLFWCVVSIMSATLLLVLLIFLIPSFQIEYELLHGRENSPNGSASLGSSPVLATLLNRSSSTQQPSANPSNFQILGELGTGAFGTVYLVKLKGNNTSLPYAIKEVNIGRMESSVDDSNRSRIRQLIIREGEILGKLDHVNIVKAYDFFLDKNICRIAMEFCDSGTLRTEISKMKSEKRYFGEIQVKQWFVQLVSVLTYLHNEHVLHRDVKSDNIFLTMGGRIVKLGDFGIAKLMETGTGGRSMIGTICYMAPEIINDQPYSTKSEVWSLGVVMYELMALRLPFNGNSLVATIEMIKNSSKPVQPIQGEHFSLPLRHFVEQKLLNKNEAERPSMASILSVSFVLQTMGKMCVSSQSVHCKMSPISSEQSLQLFSPEGDSSSGLFLRSQYSLMTNEPFSPEKLLEAAEIGDVSYLDRALKEIETNELLKEETWLFSNKDTPLHRAAKGDKIKAFKILWACLGIQDTTFGLTLVENELGDTPIHVAVRYNSVEIVEFLLQEDNAMFQGLVKRGNGRRLIHVAATHGSCNIIDLLLTKYKTDPKIKSNQSDLESTPIHLAAEFGHLAVVKQLLAHNDKLIKLEDFNGNLPIQRGAYSGRFEVVNYFITQRHQSAEIRHKRLGRTLLHCAAEYGQLSLVRELIRKFKLNIYAKSNPCDGDMLPVHLAACLGCLPVVTYFVALDAKLLTIKDGSGCYPIHRAAYANKFEVVEWCLSHCEQPVDIRDKRDGRTPLHCAAAKGRLETVTLLVDKHNADLFAKSNLDDGERSPIHLAAYYGHLDVVRYFVNTDKSLLTVSDRLNQNALHDANLGVTHKHAGTQKVVDYLKSL